MINFIISIFVSLSLVFLVLGYHFSLMPESTTFQSYLDSLLKYPMGPVGGFIGGMAASYAAITPFIRSIPERISGFRGKMSLSGEPIKTQGRIINIETAERKSLLTVHYDGHTKTFEVEQQALPRPLNVGESVTVFYDEKEPTNGYLDFYSIDSGPNSQSDSSQSSIAAEVMQSNTLFKLLDVTPRFDINSSTFEITGEIHGGEYQGKKASFMHSFPIESASKLVPGRLFQCTISGSQDDYSIQLALE